MEGIRNRLQAIKGWLQGIDRGLSQHAWYRIPRNAALNFSRRQGSRKAAAMTYFAIFSVFPFFLLLIALLSFFIDSEQAQQQVISLLSSFFPAGATGAQDAVQGVINARGVAVGFGILLLLWGALGWFQGIDRSVNEMWGVEATRPFLKGRLFALGMVSAIGLVMLLSWGANIAVDVLFSFVGDSQLQFIGGSVALLDLAVAVVSLALMFLVFLLLYRFSPMCGLTWGDVWGGALVTAVLWEITRSGFAFYVTNFANFTSAYGPIAAVIALLLWLYVANMLILFGAGITYAMRLDSQGIHELRDLRCGVPERRDRGRAAA